MPIIVDGEDEEDSDDCIFPLTDLEVDYDSNNNNKQNQQNFKPTSNYDIGGKVGIGSLFSCHDIRNAENNDSAMVTRRRRESVGCPFERPRHGANASPWNLGSVSRVVPLRVNVKGLHGSTSAISMSPLSCSPKVNWLHAVRKIKQLKDPWEKHCIIDLPSETAIRHRYHAIKKQWIVDKVEVKVEREVTRTFLLDFVLCKSCLLLLQCCHSFFLMSSS